MCRSAGAIFLPLYLFFLAVLGVPILLLQVAVGQYTSKGVWCVWNNIAPLFKGASQFHHVHPYIHTPRARAWW